MKKKYLLIVLSSIFIKLQAQNTETSQALNDTSTILPILQAQTIQTFGIIGDYGLAGANEAAVATMVKSWNPTFILSLGDNNYPDGVTATIDANIGQYYHGYIYPYTGSYGAGASAIKFYPCIGNHDCSSLNNYGAPYYKYFSLPGNERYYDFIKGDIHFFVLNSNQSEGDGVSSSSTQALWLKNKLLNSTSKWKVVYVHHSPYCSDIVGNMTYMQWPFKTWGADAVLSGHSHVYERLIVDGIPYFVNGVGGAGTDAFKSTPLAQSKFRYNSVLGAMLCTEYSDRLTFQFFNKGKTLIDSYSITKNQTALNVNITAPTNNSSFTVGSTITIQAAASGGTGVIQKVEFFAGTTKLGEDLTSPYSFAWSNATAGIYALTAKVTDNSNTIATSLVLNISVVPLGILSVNITSPANNSSFTVGSTITIQASASGGTGVIQKVEFFADTTKLGEDLASPYNFAWNNATAGSYALTAKVTDNSNASVSSLPVNISVVTSSTIDLISAGSSWKYLDNGTNQGTTWRAASFSDANWKTGNAELGYGDGGEATVVSYGPSATKKYITTYFRSTFNVVDKSTIPGLELNLIRDDGAVVYINGVEVYRNNLPAGTIYYNTLAPTYIDGAAESTWVVANLSSSSLVNGTNVIAVEIHQNAVTSSDISFNLKLKTLSGARIMDAVYVEDSIQNNTILDKKYDMLVYPNPNTGKFNLELCIEDLAEKTVLIEVANSLGQAIYKKLPQKINGCVKEVIELESSLPIGVYIMKVTIEDKIQTSKMLLTK